MGRVMESLEYANQMLRVAISPHSKRWICKTIPAKPIADCERLADTLGSKDRSHTRPTTACAM